ncbi:hypothetical protein JCM14469_13510 [Desulfatiferula olefinivorans]
MEEQTKKKVPEIRFKGFSEEWDEKPIGEVLTEIKRPIELKDNERYELVTVRRRNGGVVSRGHLHGKDILVKSYSQLRAGDFIISKRQVVHGATGLVPHHLDQAIVSNEYMVAVGNETISSEFLTILSTLPGMYRKFFLSSYGVDIEKLFFDAADWKKRKVVIPKLPEQNEICSYFEEIDRIIGLHQRKHEKLVTLKKAMLNKMFPAPGAIAPEIRFKGFSEPWEEKKLGDEAITIMGQSPSGSNYTNNPTDFILVQGNADMKNGYVTPRVWTTQITKTADIGDIILSVRAPVGEVGKTGYDVVLGRGVAGIKGNEFIFQSLLRMNEFGYWKQFSSGSTFDSINSTDIRDAILSFPSKEEQRIIGVYFRQLDELIAQHGTQVKKLKKIKTACLEKMFV